jgi:hypothetical protein
MTLPDERTRAVLNAQRFLRDLLDPKKTPRVPRKIRKAAGWALKHFPSSFDLGEAAEKAPDVFAKPEKDE